MPLLRRTLLALVLLFCGTGRAAQTPIAAEVPPALAAPFPLTTHPEADLMPALSADGKWLAYVSRQNGNYDIWVRATAGGLPRALTTNTSDDYSPCWSPDGKALVFVSRRDDAEGDLYLLKLKNDDEGLAAGQIRRLTNNLQREAFPQISPDGKKLAYALGAQQSEQIGLYEFKSGAQYQLTTRGGTQPAWSPHGNELAVACRTSDSEEHQIFIISADTTQADYLRRQITFEGDNSFPAWAPDGKQILVQRVESNTAARLFIVPLEYSASRLEQLTVGLQITPDSEGALFPCWGSDGMIYYAAAHHDNLDLWRMPARGLLPRFNTPQAAFAFAQSLEDHEAALLAYSALRFHFPDSTRWLALAGVEMGRRYLLRKDVAQARKSFNNVVLYYGGQNAGAGFAELELAKLDGNFARYAFLRERYHEWPAVQARCLFEQGRAAEQQHQYEAALQAMQAVPQEFPAVRAVAFQATLRAADLLLRQEHFEAAEARYVAALQNYREQEAWRSTTLTHLLDAAPALAQTADTLAAYQRLQQKYATLPEVGYAARFRMAERLQRDAENQLAENEWRSLIAALAPFEDVLLRELRAQALQRLLQLQIALHDLPVAELVFAQLETEHSNEASAARVQAARTELTQALLQRGRALIAGRDYELARAAFGSARRYDPQEVEAHRGYLESMNALDQIDEALVEYSQRAAKPPNDAIALYGLGLAYSYKGTRDAKILRQSCSYIEAALALNYRLVPAYLTLSFNYEAIEQLEQRERERQKGFFEKIAFALPGFLDNLRRTLTFRPPRPPARWYERAIAALTMAIALNDETREPQREAQLALNLANNYFNFGEYGYENAFRYYKIKMRYDSTFVSARQRAQVCERIGLTGYVSGNYDGAAPFMRAAVAEYRALRVAEGELLNLGRLALLYQAKGDYEVSNEYYSEYIKACRRENRQEKIASALSNIARNHQLLTESDEAIIKSNRALDLLETENRANEAKPKKNKLIIRLLGLPIFWHTVAPTGEESSTEGLTREQEREFAFSIIEESYASRKDFDAALVALRSKLASFRERKDRKGEAIAYNNLGQLWYNLGDYAQAESNYRASFTLCLTYKYDGGAIINLINLGNLALLRTQRNEDRLPAEFATIDSLLQLSRAALAQVSTQAPRQKLAVEMLLGNLAYYNAVRLWPEPAQPATAATTTLSPQDEARHALQALEYWAQARAAYATGLALTRAQRLVREEIAVRRNLANLFLLVEDFATAFTHLRVAHELCVANNFANLTWRLEYALGVVTQLAPEFAVEQKSARAWFESAIALLESLPEEPEDIEQRRSESDEQRALYERAITHLARQHETRAALELAERRQARAFMSLAATRYLQPKRERHRVYWGGGGGSASELRRILSRLQAELLKLQAEDPQRPKELARVRRELQLQEQEYQNLVQSALKEDRELASFFSVQPIALQSVQDSLPAHTAMLRYVVAEDEIVMWRITRTEVEQRRVPYSRASLQAEVARVRNLWQAHHPESAAAAQTLAQLLLAPWENLQNYSHLIIVPDEALHYLPFAALPYHDSRLGQQCALAYAASLQAWQFAVRHKNLASEEILLLQDADAAVPEYANNLAPLRLRTLTGVDWRAGSSFHGEVQAAGIIHVQSTFVAQPERALDSAILLRVRTGANVEALRLPVSRLFESELRASMLVLENASFSYRAGQRGDEMIALQRSLFYAGVPSLVVSLWQTAPAVRATFLQQLYANLPSQPLAEAFQSAQLATRAQHPESEDWCAFVLLGDRGMTQAEQKNFAQRYFLENVASGNKAQEFRDFGAAVRYYRNALTMAKQLNEQEAQARLLLLMKQCAIYQGDFATACEVEEALLAAARNTNDVRLMALSYQNLSVWRLRLKDYAAAEQAEQQFLALAQAGKNALAESGSHYRFAQIYQAAQDFARARAAAERAAQILAEKQEALSRLQVETFLGKLALEQDRYDEALQYLNAALAAFAAAAGEKTFTAAEQRALAIAKQLSGTAYARLTAYRRALALHQEALEIFTVLRDTANIVRAEQFVAETSWLNAEFQAALQHQLRALHWLEALPDAALRIRAHTTLGLIKLNLGDLQGALAAQKQALSIALDWEETQTVEARRDQATVDKNLGLTYLQLKQPQQALASFKQALQWDDSLQVQRGLLYDCLFIGQVLPALNQPDSALHYLKRAESLAQQLQDQRALAKTFFMQGQALQQLHQRGAAQAAFARALAQAEQFHVAELLWRCAWKLASIAKQEGRWESAWEYYQRALANLEQLSANLKVEEYRSGFIDDKAELYEEAVLLLLQLKRDAEAFAVAERAKSRSFADMLGNSGVNWQEAQGGNRELLQRRTRLLETISFVQGQLAAQQAQSEDRAPAAALRDSLAALQKTYAALALEIKATSPELADAVSVAPLPLAEVQNMMADSVALVEYFFAKDRLVSWVIDRTQVRAVSLPLDRVRLAENIAQFRRALQKRASTEMFSRALYEVLLKPVAPLLAQARQLVIVPHGALHYVPFAALQQADSTYLIDHYALALAPSATVLGFCYRKGNADWRHETSAARVFALGNPETGNARMDLPFAEKEIKSLAQTFEQAEVFTRKAANRSAVRAAQAAHLLHFSCHGVYDEANPLFSALLLAPENEQDDGRLAAHEVLGLKLHAQLVLLSACETGLARVTGGDEVVGLARSFIFAGTPSLIASLWTVDDLATAITVKRFYRNLKAGASKAEALRAAQVFVRDHHNRHPAYWASFGLTGDWR